MYSTIKTSRDGEVVTLTFNRPEKRNAMSPELHKEMLDFLTSVRNDPSVRVLVLTGAGNSFTAGMDLEKYFLEQRPHPSKMDDSRRCFHEWTDILRTLPLVTIAAVNGWCFGAGLRVLSLCDIAVASEKAVFGASEINFGVIPAGGVMKSLVDLLSWRDSLYLTLVGNPISAEEACKMRLVNSVVPDSKLYDEVYALASKVKVHNPMTVRIAKEVFRNVRPMEDSTAYDYEIGKTEQLTYLRGNEWVNTGLKKFQRGEFKPGLESYATKDQTNKNRSKEE